MTANQPGSPLDSSGDRLPEELQHLLDRQEANLVDLERLVLEERLALLDPEGGHLLGLLQDIEEALGRIGRLEGHRSRLDAKIGVGMGVFPAPAASAGAEAPGAQWLGSLLESRHRILGLIARIAECGEANHLLIEGLARMGKVRLDRLSCLETPEAFGVSHGLRLGGRHNSAEAFDVSA